jgi:hypothetical protein
LGQLLTKHFIFSCPDTVAIEVHVDLVTVGHKCIIAQAVRTQASVLLLAPWVQKLVNVRRNLSLVTASLKVKQRLIIAE